MNHTDNIQKNEQLIRRYFNEVWNQGNLLLLDEIIAAHYTNHSSSLADTKPGPSGLKPIVAAMRIAFPDLHYEIRDLVLTGDRIVARVIMSGTHRGDFFGMAPTNKKVYVNQINIEYVEQGKIVEHWRITDELTLMKQLGF